MNCRCVRFVSLSGCPSTFPTFWCSIGKICHTSKLIEKFDCFYCSYGNGVAAYACEVAAHDRYPRFFEYGDAEADWQCLNRLRRQYEDEERKQGGSGWNLQFAVRLPDTLIQQLVRQVSAVLLWCQPWRRAGC